MSKYDPLYKYLNQQKRTRISMTFSSIESLLGFRLPSTARQRSQWWANEISRDTRHVQCKAWLDSGFETANLDLVKETVDFIPI